jgi:hypothetical protein
MATITITIPNAKAPDVAKAVADIYGVAETATGVRDHLIAHLRQTVRDYQKGQAAKLLNVDMTNPTDWGDLAG